MRAMLEDFDRISRAAPQPIYQQIKQLIQRRIDSGEWAAGRKLPSENELVAALDVSRMTINRALRELTQQGLVTRVHGVGSFVAESPRHASLIELQDIALEIERDGGQHRSRVLALETRPASAEAAVRMEIPPGERLYYLRAVHYRDGVPIQLESRFVNAAAMPGFIEQDFTRTTATAYLLGQFKPDEMEHRVAAVISDDETRELLSMAPGQPCLRLTRRTWKQDRIVTCATLLYPGDRYELGARYATDEYQLR